MKVFQLYVEKIKDLKGEENLDSLWILAYGR